MMQERASLVGKASPGAGKSSDRPGEEGEAEGENGDGAVVVAVLGEMPGECAMAEYAALLASSRVQCGRRERERQLDSLRAEVRCVLSGEPVVLDGRRARAERGKKRRECSSSMRLY